MAIVSNSSPMNRVDVIWISIAMIQSGWFLSLFLNKSIQLTRTSGPLNWIRLGDNKTKQNKKGNGFNQAPIGNQMKLRVSGIFTVGGGRRGRERPKMDVLLFQ